ncbi:MAG TPA: electron transfer flavoprotein subunit alpha/FixB family protein [Desulfopila sp.]|nr:electron transfer flavoprotein subunit alpha/FixB family protein [Desulfopila sp.]
MKTLLVAEYRDGKLLGSTNELIAFAEKTGGESAMFLVGTESAMPAFAGKLYLAEAAEHGEYNPSVHRDLLLQVVEKEQPDVVVFSHSSYGWDLAPRLAYAMGAAQISEVIDVVDSMPVVPVCNAKLRRNVKVNTDKAVYTLQAGAFSPDQEPSGSPEIEKIHTGSDGKIIFEGYEAAESGGVDLGKSDIIVSAGRGIGKPENVEMIAALAKALKGEYGASRPVVDAEWVEHNRQVGTTGQTVSPKLYVACGISGAIQHLAGMKKSDFVVAINTDKDAPIGEVADVLVVADLKQFVPALTEKVNSL